MTRNQHSRRSKLRRRNVAGYNTWSPRSRNRQTTSRTITTTECGIEAIDSGSYHRDALTQLTVVSIEHHQAPGGVPWLASAATIQIPVAMVEIYRSRDVAATTRTISKPISRLPLSRVELFSQRSHASRADDSHAPAVKHTGSNSAAPQSPTTWRFEHFMSPMFHAAQPAQRRNSCLNNELGRF